MGHSLAVRIDKPISQAVQQALMKQAGGK